MITQITEFLGTCISEEIGTFAEGNGRTFSYRKACKLIKQYSNEMFNELALQLRNPWADHTNIKTRKGVKYLHIVHSCTDYIFIVE